MGFFRVFAKDGLLLDAIASYLGCSVYTWEEYIAEGRALFDRFFAGDALVGCVFDPRVLDQPPIASSGDPHFPFEAELGNWDFSLSLLGRVPDERSVAVGRGFTIDELSPELRWVLSNEAVLDRVHFGLAGDVDHVPRGGVTSYLTTCFFECISPLWALYLHTFVFTMLYEKFGGFIHYHPPEHLARIVLPDLLDYASVHGTLSRSTINRITITGRPWVDIGDASRFGVRPRQTSRYYRAGSGYVVSSPIVSIKSRPRPRPGDDEQ
jgi:hypothetical protein